MCVCACVVGGGGSELCLCLYFSLHVSYLCRLPDPDWLHCQSRGPVCTPLIRPTNEHLALPSMAASCIMHHDL